MSKSVMTDFRRFLAPVKKIKLARDLQGDFEGFYTSTLVPTCINYPVININKVLAKIAFLEL